RAMRSRTKALAQDSARAGENGPGVRPCPGKSGTNTRKSWFANSCALKDMTFLLAARPCKRTTEPTGEPERGSERSVAIGQPRAGASPVVALMGSPGAGEAAE